MSKDTQQRQGSLKGFLESSQLYLDLLKKDDGSMKDPDRAFLAYNAIADHALAMLIDRDLSVPDVLAAFLPQAAEYAERLTFDRQIARFLYADPIPDEYGFEYLFELTEQRVQLEAFLILAARLCNNDTLRHLLRKTRLTAVRFDNTSIVDYPAVGSVLAGYVKEHFAELTFPDTEFSWWVNADERLERAEVPSDAAIKDLVRRQVTREAAAITIAAFMPVVMERAPDDEDSPFPITACYSEKMSKILSGYGQLSAASDKKLMPPSVLFLVHSQDDASVFIVFDKTKVFARVIAQAKEDPEPSFALDGFILRLDFDGQLVCKTITSSKVEFDLPVMKKPERVYVDLLDSEGTFIERLSPS